ncbi:MAG: wcaJ [Frankiales bacterium]|nr:wcaJ [Frankiales bacterium]
MLPLKSARSLTKIADLKWLRDPHPPVSNLLHDVLHDGRIQGIDKGMTVLGAVVGRHQTYQDLESGDYVNGTLDNVAEVVKQYEVDTVAVLPCPELDGSALGRLGWDLEKTAPSCSSPPRSPRSSTPGCASGPSAAYPSCTWSGRSCAVSAG